eukprot:1925781-Pyramimonas_sp.AAC.1
MMVNRMRSSSGKSRMERWIRKRVTRRGRGGPPVPVSSMRARMLAIMHVCVDVVTLLRPVRPRGLPEHPGLPFWVLPQSEAAKGRVRAHPNMNKFQAA